MSVYYDRNFKLLFAFKMKYRFHMKSESKSKSLQPNKSDKSVNLKPMTLEDFEKLSNPTPTQKRDWLKTLLVELGQ